MTQTSMFHISVATVLLAAIVTLAASPAMAEPDARKQAQGLGRAAQAQAFQ